MFNLDTDTVLLKIKTTGQRLVFVAFFVTKNSQNSVFTHILNRTVYFLYAYSFNKEKVGTNFVALLFYKTNNTSTMPTILLYTK